MKKKAGVFYNVKNGSPFIASKSSSENLSSHNKYLCFLLSSRQNVNKNANSLELLKFFDELFDVTDDGPFLML